MPVLISSGQWLGGVDIYEPCNGLSGLSKKSSPIAEYAFDLRTWNSRSFRFLAFCYHAHRIHGRSAVQIRHQTSALAKHPPIKPSRTARKAVSQPTSILQPTLQANACRAITKAFCAVQASRRLRAAFFAYFFFLLKKSKSPKASEATNDLLGPNALSEQATQLLICA